MKHGNLKRESVVAAYGEEFVTKLDEENCVPTGRVQCDGDTDIEYASSLEADNGDTVTAYYYLTADQQKIADDAGDLGLVDWQIQGYEIA